MRRPNHRRATAEGGGAPASGLDFEADSTQYARIASNASVTTGDILQSYSCRVKLESKAADQIFMGKFDEANLSGRDYALLYRTATDRISLWLVSAGGDQHIVAADVLGSPSVGVWYVVTGTHDSVANATSLRVNGGAADTGSFTFGVREGTADFRVGIGHSALWPLDGIMDWAGLWKGRVLDATDHALLYNAGFSQDFTTLNAGLLTNQESWWDFDDAASPSIDKQGANDLAWVNGPTPVLL